jgi:hypothetical protein
VRQQNSNIDRVRQIMAPGNPVPESVASGAWNDEQGRQAHQRIMAVVQDTPGDAAPETASWGSAGDRRLPRGPAAPGRRFWRGMAPVAAGLAVVGLVAGLTLVGGSHPTRPGTGVPVSEGSFAASKVPAYYVTLGFNAVPGGVANEVLAEVHSSKTGQVLSYVAVGTLGGLVGGVAAEPSHGDFLLYRTLNSGEVVTSVLHVSSDGRSVKLQHSPLVLEPSGSKELVQGIAVSPDGSKVAAVLMRGPANSLKTQGAIRVYSMTGGATRTWTAPRDPGSAWTPVWSSNRQLTFVWQDHLHGSARYFYVGRSEVRVLDTSAAGHSLLSSTVLPTEGAGLTLFQSLGAGSADSPVVVAVIAVTSLGGHGTEDRQLMEMSASGSVMKIVSTNSVKYSGLEQEGLLSAQCQVFAETPDGAMLADNPNFGMIVDGKFTPLAHSTGDWAAAW